MSMIEIDGQRDESEISFVHSEWVCSSIFRIPCFSKSMNSLEWQINEKSKSLMIYSILSSEKNSIGSQTQKLLKKFKGKYGKNKNYSLSPVYFMFIWKRFSCFSQQTYMKLYYKLMRSWKIFWIWMIMTVKETNIL